MRGSTTPYSVLAIRLPVNTKAAENSAMPTNSAASPPRPAVTAACPRPGYENTCSTSTDPPNISDMDANCNVSAGSARLRRPWWRRAPQVLNPRARANRT